LSAHSCAGVLESINELKELVLVQQEMLAEQSRATQHLLRQSLASWKHDTNSSRTAAESQGRFKEALFAHLGLSRNRKTGVCMVTGLTISRKALTAGHICSQKNADAARAVLGITNINDPRNGILWCHAFERAWSYNKICFVATCACVCTGGQSLDRCRSNFECVRPCLEEEAKRDVVDVQDMLCIRLNLSITPGWTPL
jgi:hypothetical protein